MLQHARRLIDSLVLVTALLCVSEGLVIAQAPATAPCPDEAPFREAVRQLRAGVFSGWPSLCVAPSEDADARPQRRALARPFDSEGGGGVFLEGRYTTIGIQIARVENPDEATKAAYEEAYTTLRGWFLEERDEWLLREGFAPQEGLWEDSRCASIYPIRRGQYEFGIQFWLRKTPIGRGRDEWVLTLTGYGKEQGPGWTIAQLRQFLGERTENAQLAPFAAWFEAQGFDDADVLVGIDSYPLRLATEQTVEAALTGLPTRRTARVLVQRGDLLHELSAPVAGAGPGIVQHLHERREADGLTHDEYVQALASFDWDLAAEVLATMDADRDTGFANWIAGLPGPGGIYNLRPNPLSRNLTTRWQRLVVRGDLVLLQTVLFSSDNPTPRQIEAYLRNHLRASLQDEGVETRYDLLVSFSEIKPSGGGSWQYCVDLGLRDAELAAALKECRHLKLEPVSGDCQDGWGTARLAETGETFEGFFERGLPAGVIRRVHPTTGAVLVSNFRGATPHGPFIEFDPSQSIARMGVAEDGEVTDDRWIPSWTGADGKAEFHTLDGLEGGPVVTYRGELLSGDPRDGRCVVEIPDFGKFTGSFVEHVAQGEGLLETPSGRLYKIDCYDGVPRLVRTLRAPDGERLAFYEKHKGSPGPDGDCLQGDCLNGEGVAYLGHEGRHPQIYRGAFRNGLPHGQGVLTEGRTRYAGQFRNGKYVPPPPPDPTVRTERPKTEPNSDFIPIAQPIRTCMSCGGYGYYTTRGYYVDEVEVRPFMPGQRHYGSWLWSGYEQKTGRQVWQPGETYRCRRCGGTGRTR